MIVNKTPITEPTAEEDRLATQIVDGAFQVHQKLGPGLLESIYEKCFCYELSKRNLIIQQQVMVPIQYDELIINEGLRLDVLVENRIICELKAAEVTNPVWKAQLLSYMKLADKRLGFLINFNVKRIKDGIERFIL
ncbi:MAG: hypothetical protein HJJLKODD_01767 [Phycisphaerae bacterium]|nr:hypothetical protein [Phycisphaerae bacterium]